MVFNYYCRNFRYEEDSVVSCSISNQYGSSWSGYYGATTSTYVEIINARDNNPFTASISDSLIEVEIIADSSLFFQTPSTSNGLMWITLFN